MHPKPPFSINIFWHKDFKEGLKYAATIYHHFARDPQQPLIPSIGIPTHFCRIVEAGLLDLSFISTDDCKTLNILLIEEAFVESKKTIQQFEKWFDDAFSKKDPDDHLLFPIGISKNALELESNILEKNFLRLFNSPEKRKEADLLIALIHEAYRLLEADICHDNEGTEKSKIRNPARLFLSHAKKDGQSIAARFRNYIREQYSMDTFFDENDIPIGSKFEEVLEERIKQSMLLGIHTDGYSNSPWCRKELLTAKKHNRPIVMINALDKGEPRTFPYIGNVTTIRNVQESILIDLKPSTLEEEIEAQMDRILIASLKENLRSKYHGIFTSYLATCLDIPTQNLKVSTLAPELLTFFNLGYFDEPALATPSEEVVFVYPSPPINEDEQRILRSCQRRLGANFQWFTPSQLSLYGNRHLIEKTSKLKVALAISTNQEEEITQLPIRDALIEITKFLLPLQIRLVYGGDLFYEPKEGDVFNYTKLLIDIAAAYQTTVSTVENQHNTSTEDNNNPIIPTNKIFKEHKPPIKIINYNAYPFYYKLDPLVIERYRSIVQFIKVEPDKFLQVGDKEIKEIFNIHNHHTSFVKAQCLTKMRRLITKETHARIILGGKVTDYAGKYPGILEEFLESKQKNQPIYLIGGFGGCAGEIAKQLQGQESKLFSESLKKSYYSDNSFSNFYNQNDWVEPADKILEPHLLAEKIAAMANTNSLKNDFGLNNHLSEAENMRLFTSTDIQEVVMLILVGLQRIAEGTDEEINNLPI